jgi:hypothetical protein
VVICVDERALRNYYRVIRKVPVVVKDRVLQRVYDDVRHKYFVTTQDGFIQMIGNLVPNRELIIEGIPNSHGKEDVWLLHIQSGDS